ncbi:MAG: hypothetical protein H3C62_03355 [Gemmatimonadaceae bacterium]|nr:hypothetical protein [Gemmatimonadaceae bacterium]
MANPSGEEHFERLVGRRGIRPHLDRSPQGVDAALVRRWTDTGDWSARVGTALLYD